MLVGLLSSLSRFINFSGKTDIDSPVSKLHHNFTTLILLGFCLVVSASSLIGNPIHCTYGSHSLMNEDMINTYCWIHSTFTLPRNYRSAAAIYPGLSYDMVDNERVYHAYYQWVPFVLFLQALMFYAPYWLWKMLEGGKVESASQDLTAPIMNKEDRKEKIEIVGEYLYATLRQHNKYAIKYFVYEILNFIITIANIWLINSFLGGKFISYGTEVFSFDQMNSEDRTDPMIVLFPRMTKCTFRVSGPSGTTERLDSLCVLPHNIVNEKIYIFLWLWLWVLVVAGALSIMYRALALFVPAIRLHLLKNYTQGLNKNDEKILSAHLGVGDYFLFYLLHKNVSHLAFTDLVRDLASRIPIKVHNSLEMGNLGTGVKGYQIMSHAT